MSLKDAVGLLLKILTRNPELMKALIHEVIVMEVGHSTPHWRMQGPESGMLSDMTKLLVHWNSRLPDDPTEPRRPPMQKPNEAKP